MSDDLEWTQQLVATMAYPVIIADNLGVIRVWNPAAVALFGHTASEAIGQSTELVIPPDLRAAHAACHGKAMQSPSGYSSTEDAVVPAIHRDGSALALTINLSVLADASGRVTGSALVIRAAEKAT